jgi:hypothetical protein
MSGIRVAGRSVRFLERIPVAGEIVGLPSRATSYRVAASDDWPLVGPENSRFVAMAKLLDRYGVPYQIEDDVQVAQ